MRRINVAWECAHCGARHVWKWPLHEVSGDELITMLCDKASDKGCGGRTGGMLRKIGAGAYALTERKKS